MSSTSPVDWIALVLLPGLGPITIRQAYERFGDPGEVAYRVPAQTLVGVGGFGPAAVGALEEARKTVRKRAEREWRTCQKFGIRVIPCTDADFPASLEMLPDRPPLLYVQGSVRHDVLRIATVGSRNPTAYGRRVAAGLAAGFADRGIEVVAGGARGIDTVAHRAALEEGGRTVAVLGSGLLHRYPYENEDLFERIATQGAVVSEFGLNEPPQAHHFPRRNRLISGLSVAVVVVEASRRSGSLITAAHALDQGREVLAVPGPVSSARSVGCNRLIQQGAKLVQNLDDVLDELPPIYRNAAGERTSADPAGDPPDSRELTPDEVTVLGLLDEVEPLHLDALAEKAPFGVARLQAALFGLELVGAVEHSPGRYYLSRPRRNP